MNVFVIPSWYPSAANPIAGVFVREQAYALAALRPDWNVVLSRWGHHDGALSLRSPRASLNALRWRMRAGGSRWLPSAPPLREVMTPALSWTLAFSGGGAAGLLRATRHNLALARVRFGRVDLMHAHVGFPAGWIAAQLGAETGIPFVLTEHMSPFPFPALRSASGGVTPALCQAFERAAATVAVSPSLAAQIRAHGLPCSHVIPNVVDERRFVPGTAPVPARPFVFFTLGAMTAQKGVDVLLRALARWNPAGGEVELRIGGDGPQRAAYQRLAVELGVDDRVRWLGAVPPEAAPRHFADCHAFVLASRHETFGVVLAEALMCGKPVVATRSGGPESIVNEANGLLVGVDDVAGLAEALATMARCAGDFDAGAIRADALQRFSRSAVAGQLVQVFEAVLAR
jgi:glycosyltransferase involved in cell wall biosynthesis